MAYALRRVDDPADAADAVAETLLVAWRRLDDVATGADAEPWLLAVARPAPRTPPPQRGRSSGAGASAYRPAVPTESDLLVRRALA